MGRMKDQAIRLEEQHRSALKQQILELLEQMAITYDIQARLAKRMYAIREAQIKSELCNHIRRLVDKMIN